MLRSITNDASWNHKDRQLVINTTKNSGCYTEILSAIASQLDALLSRRSRVLVIRVDLHVSSYTGDNAKISRMLDKLKRWLRDRYNMVLSGHAWVREMEKAKRQHYHLALLLDARQIRHPNAVLEWIERYWQARNEPKPFTPRNCFTLVSRGNGEAYQKAIYRLSYLAKTRGKGYKDTTANNYSVSRLKPASN